MIGRALGAVDGDALDRAVGAYLADRHAATEPALAASSSASGLSRAIAVDGKALKVVFGHRIADDLAGGQVQPAGQVEPALVRGQAGDASDQARSGPGSSEVTAASRLIVGDW